MNGTEWVETDISRYCQHSRGESCLTLCADRDRLERVAAVWLRYASPTPSASCQTGKGHCKHNTPITALLITTRLIKNPLWIRFTPADFLSHHTFTSKICTWTVKSSHFSVHMKAITSCHWCVCTRAGGGNLSASESLKRPVAVCGVKPSADATTAATSKAQHLGGTTLAADSASCPFGRAESLLRQWAGITAVTPSNLCLRCDDYNQVFLKSPLNKNTVNYVLHTLPTQYRRHG